MGEFEVGVLADFVAQHYLAGRDFGPEGSLHSHHYRVELVVSGAELDQHGFLVDIVPLRAELDELLGRYRDRTLNDLPEFAGLNPGVEVVARAMAVSLDRALAGETLRTLTLKLWENDTAWASYRVVRQPSEPSGAVSRSEARSAERRAAGVGPRGTDKRARGAREPRRRARTKDAN